MVKRSGWVFKYDETWGGLEVFKRAYKIVDQTENHVRVQHWYGKRWHPLNRYWQLDEPIGVPLYATQQPGMLGALKGVGDISKLAKTLQTTHPLKQRKPHEKQ